MVINQFRGYGDIMFLQPLISELKGREGALFDTIYLPVMDTAIGDYIPDAHVVDMNKFKLDYESMDTDNPDYFPARFANQIMTNTSPDDHSDLECMMLDKYRLADELYGGIDEKLWTQINLQRNPEREEALYKHLGEPENFHLINANYAGYETAEVKPKLGKAKRVYLEYVPGFTVVDWCGIMEKAKSNHHVSTSTFYLMQMLKLENCHIYPRPDDPELKGISQLVPMCDFECNLVLND